MRLEQHKYGTRPVCEVWLWCAPLLPSVPPSPHSVLCATSSFVQYTLQFLCMLTLLLVIQTFTPPPRPFPQGLFSWLWAPSVDAALPSSSDVTVIPSSLRPSQTHTATGRSRAHACQTFACVLCKWKKKAYIPSVESDPPFSSCILCLWDNIECIWGLAACALFFVVMFLLLAFFLFSFLLPSSSAVSKAFSIGQACPWQLGALASHIGF